MKNQNSESIAQRWQNLLNQLDIIEKGTIPTFPNSDLLSFEARTGIILPYGYKEFCQVIGSGTFGHFVHIGFPDINGSIEMIELFQQSLESGKSMNMWGRDVEYLEPIFNFTESLLGSAFVFGSTDTAKIFLWDLRSYSELDRNYNIYLASFDFPEVYLVGRDFLEFVRDFCLGNKAFEVLPQGIWPNPKEVNLTFTRWGVINVNRH
jgi:hypothetical protein